MSHQRLAGTPRAGAGGRCEDQERARGIKAREAPSKNGNAVGAGPRRNAFVSLPAWLMECFCSCRRCAEKRGERHGPRRPELRWHGPLFFV
jgi:hypothetical protein